MRSLVKAVVSFLSAIIVLPFSLVSILEDKVTSGNSEALFNFSAHVMAMLPGKPGSYLRRAFYVMSLESCSPSCHIGFGTIFSHRNTTIGEHVYFGSYALVGSAEFGHHCLIGSRASVLSGGSLHVREENGMWSPYTVDRLEKVKLSQNVWVGEGAIIVADIGAGCMVGAGSVVTSTLKANIMVSGNPARFVKNIV